MGNHGTKMTYINSGLVRLEFYRQAAIRYMMIAEDLYQGRQACITVVSIIHLVALVVHREKLIKVAELLRTRTAICWGPDRDDCRSAEQENGDKVRSRQR